MGLLPKLHPRDAAAGHGTTNRPMDDDSGARLGGKEGGYSVPVGAIPLLATEFHGYSDVLTVVSTAANKVYREFLKSEEGQNFAGQVHLLRIINWFQSHMHTHTCMHHACVCMHVYPTRPLHTAHIPLHSGTHCTYPITACLNCCHFRHIVLHHIWISLCSYVYPCYLETL